jgi:hypothetical protein
MAKAGIKKRGGYLEDPQSRGTLDKDGDAIPHAEIYISAERDHESLYMKMHELTHEAEGPIFKRKKGQPRPFPS